MPHIILLGTLDSKLQEFLYLHDRLVSSPVTTANPVNITLIDCGRAAATHENITVTQSDLLSRYGRSNDAPALMDWPRGEVIKYMTACTTACVKDLVSKGDIHGIISAGGSGGTSLAAAVMREAVPIGLPKLIVSTVASGDTGPFVGETDITMMYSVVDIAGNNQLLRNVLSNAAGAIVGMAATYEESQRPQSGISSSQKTRIGVTMFGVTTPCVDKVRKYLESKYEVEVFVFHATGHGGRAMERLIEEARLDAVLDITTTEICDFLMGGSMSAGPNRLGAGLQAGIPYVISLGATDMVNFGPLATVPEKYQGRKLFEHNPTVTLMRTTPDECRRVGEFVVEKIKSFAKNKSKVEIRIPKGGVSMIATPGAAFADTEADQQLIDAIQSGLQASGVKVVEDSHDINDERFATSIADQVMALVDSTAR